MEGDAAEEAVPEVASGRNIWSPGLSDPVKPQAIPWLLEDDQPAAKYFALTELLGRRPGEQEVKEARESIPAKGWAAQILGSQKPSGWWVSDETLYRPKYLSTNWMLLVLSDLGLTKEDPRISAACELWIQRFSKPDGGFGTEGQRNGELCLVGNTARALVKFGYADHPKVASAFEWLVKHQKDNGGWHCWGSSGTIDAWEGMSAFAAYPREKWTRGMKRAVERGAEFYLERRLHRQGKPYDPWYRLHYPAHYYYDILVGLDMITALGYGGDPRLDEALEILKGKMKKGGRWDLEAVHPDTPYAKDPKRAKRFKPFSIEREGRPSKMVTLRALTVLKRVEDLRPSRP